MGRGRRHWGTGLVAAGVVLAAGAPAVARKLQVDPTGVTCPKAQYRTIQSAIDAAGPRDKILVCPGEYPEQLTITRPLKLTAQQGALLRPQGLVANTSSARTGAPIAAAIALEAQATVQGLSVDASAHGQTECGGPLLVGVYVRGVAATLRDLDVVGVRLPALEDAACDTGLGILVHGSGGGATKVKLLRNHVGEYQRAGIIVNEPGVNATLKDNVVLGAGPTPGLIQNGIQVGFGASARVIDNIVQDNSAPSGSDCTFDAGTLFFDANGGLVRGNLFTGNASGLIVNGSGNRILRNIVDSLTRRGPAGLDGIAVFGDQNLLKRNTVRNASQVGLRITGSGNRAIRNAVYDTRAATLCDAQRAEPGCEAVLATCGVGIWVSGGTGNQLKNNLASGNDVEVLDASGLGTSGR